MPAISLIPTEDDDSPLCTTPQRRFPTFIVPALGGCNLKCSYCLVRQRQETAETSFPAIVVPGFTTPTFTDSAPALTLAPRDYGRFIGQAAISPALAAPISRSGNATQLSAPSSSHLSVPPTTHTPIYALSIQGHEPLLQGSRAYTQAILARGRMLGIPTALVTNGTHLANDNVAEWLATLAPTKIAVSLDAADAATHDRLRGVSGAWEATVSGIKRAVAVLAPRTKIAVGSVLMPSKPESLEGMPRLLRSLGVTDWLITPLLRIGGNAPGGPVGSRRMLYRSLARLQDAANDAKVRLTVDDELDCLQHESACTAQPELRRFRVRTVPKGVDIIRLGPDGACTANHDILRRVTAFTPRWLPGENAGEFLDRNFKEKKQPHLAAFGGDARN